jgi:hypothetical protein
VEGKEESTHSHSDQIINFPPSGYRHLYTPFTLIESRHTGLLGCWVRRERKEVREGREGEGRGGRRGKWVFFHSL